MTVITTESLTKRFSSSVTALDELTIDVGTGVTGLVGANGAGKSTLIKILLGLLPASSGQATVLDTEITAPNADGARLRGLCGYMPEHDCLPPDVSATEFVVHMARISGLPADAARERAADTLRHVGLHEERYRPIGGYSTGMKQRVKLAQAIVHDPRLVFLDEPTNGLDPQGRDEMLDLVRRIGSEFQISVLVTSHLLGELERITDRVVIIDGGRLLRSSETTTFLQTTGTVQVEVTEDADRVAEALTAAGLTVRQQRGQLDVLVEGDHTYDTIRDEIAKLGAGLLRLQAGRHRIEEVFRNHTEETTHESAEYTASADVGEKRDVRMERESSG